MRSEYPSHIVRRVCEKTGVDAGEMLTALLVALAQHSSVATVAERPGQTPTALNEITGFMAVAKHAAPPRSVLDYLAHALRYYAERDAHDCKVTASGDRAALAARAKAGRALANVMQQVINQSEHLGLSAKLQAEEEAKSKGRKRRDAGKAPDEKPDRSG